MGVEPAMKYALLVFAGTWLSVFTLGLQSLNVNQGHYLAAAITSIGIGTGHIILYKYMPGADALEIAAYLLAGISGITFSMWFHRRAKDWLSLRIARSRARRVVDEHADVGRCGANGDVH
jgi:hypothetical protein